MERNIQHSRQKRHRCFLLIDYYIQIAQWITFTQAYVCVSKSETVKKMNVKQSNLKWRNENYRGKLKDFDFRDTCLWVPWYPMPFVCCLPTSIPHPSLLFSPATPSSDLPLPLSLLLLPLNPPPLLLPVSKQKTQPYALYFLVPLTGWKSWPSGEHSGAWAERKGYGLSSSLLAVFSVMAISPRWFRLWEPLHYSCNSWVTGHDPSFQISLICQSSVTESSPFAPRPQCLPV